MITNNNNGTKTLKRSEMYASMMNALDSVKTGETLLLSSFQSGHPLKQLDSDELVAYHTRLSQVVHSFGKEIEVRRLLAIQEIEKLQWLDILIDDFGDGGTNFNLRAYPTRPAWRTNGHLEPLPVQVQVISETVFVGAARENSGQRDKEMFGIQIDPWASPNSSATRFFTSHHAALWEHAGADKSNLLISHGHPLERNVLLYKWRLCTSWLAHKVNAITSPLDLSSVAREIHETLLPIKRWYWTNLAPERIQESYARYPLNLERRIHGPWDETLNTDPCEVMIAHWRKNQMCWPHDHGKSSGVVIVLQGKARVTHYVHSEKNHTLTKQLEPPRILDAGKSAYVDGDIIHAMESISDEDLVTLHIYFPSPPSSWIYDICGRRRLQIKSGGAYLPREDKAILQEEPCGYVEAEALVQTSLTSKKLRTEHGATSVKRAKGRPPSSEDRRKQDSTILEAWKSRRYKTKEELSRELGIDVQSVSQALDRERHRHTSERNNSAE